METAYALLAFICLVLAGIIYLLDLLPKIPPADEHLTTDQWDSIYGIYIAWLVLIFLSGYFAGLSRLTESV